jgi:hypothetical protein
MTSHLVSALTFAETLLAYPGGLPALANAAGVSGATLRRTRDTAFAKAPLRHLQRLAAAPGWQLVAGMSVLAPAERLAHLLTMYGRARRYPECGHSACSQHFIDTGITACIRRSHRTRHLVAVD